MTQEVLDRAIKLRESIKCIDDATDFISEQKRAFLQLQSGFGENAAYSGFTKMIQEFFLYEVLPEYRARLVDELDKL